MSSINDEFPSILKQEESLSEFLKDLLNKPRKMVQQTSEDMIAELQQAVKAYKESDEQNKLLYFKKCLKAACTVKLAEMLYKLMPENTPEERASIELEVSFW